MPYIGQEDRNNIDWRMTEVLKFLRKGAKPGEVAYIIYRIATEWLKTTKPSYMDLALMLGVLESIKLEFNRRVITVYEDVKIRQNGDVE